MASSITNVGSPDQPRSARFRILRRLPDRSFDDLAEAGRTRARRLSSQASRRWQEDPGLAAWQIATSPLWLGSGIPSPDRPVLRPSLRLVGGLADRDGIEQTPQGRWLSGQLHTLTQRFWVAWIVAAALRGIALGALACTIWTLGAIVGGWPQPRMAPFVAVVLLGAVIGLVFGVANRPSIQRVASMLDRTFDLNERMVTAIEPPDAALPPRIRGIQLADAANAFEEIHQDVRGAAVLPLRAMVIAALALIALLTALLFNIASTGTPATDPLQIPAFVPSSERFAREAQAQKAQQLADAAKQPPAAIAPASTPGSVPAGELGGLRAVGNALGTNPVTEPSASRIAQGDFPGAQDQLEQNAQAAASLPQAERDALADELYHAADRMDDGALKDATQKAADGLREGGDAAVNGLNDLARQIGESGEQATTEGQASSSGESQQSSQGSSRQSGSSQAGQSGDSGQQSSSADTGGSDTSGTSQDAPQGDPGSGMAAAPGIGSDPSASDASGQQGGASAGKDGQPGQSGQAGQAGQPGQADQSAASGASSGGASQSSGAASGQAGSTGQQGADTSGQAETGGSQGGGASGSTDASDQAKAGGAGSGTEQKPSDTAQDGKASSNPPPGGTQSSSGSGDTQQPSGGNETLVLQGTSNEDGVATGNDTGASSSGSGSGAGAASGSATQGSVGPAGPDSNRVPDRYRDLVKAYFNGNGLPPDEDQP